MGSVFRRSAKSPCWYARIKDPAGRWIARSLGPTVKTEDQARVVLAQIERDLARGQASVVAASATVRDVVDPWIERRQARGLRNTESERCHLVNHVVPRIGHLRPSEVRRADVVRLVDELRASSLAPKTVLNVYSTLRRLFGDLEARGEIERSPCALRRGELPEKRPKDPAFRTRAIFTRDEAEILISAPGIPPERRVVNAIALLAGPRIGEIAGLRWSDIDPTVGPLATMTISRSFAGPTKTNTVREVPIHPVLGEILVEWRAVGFRVWADRDGDPEPDDLVVPSPDGGMWNDKWFRDRFHRDLKRLGLRRRRVHDMRRTFVTLASQDSGRADLVEVISHKGRGDVLAQYTSFPWEALCGAVAAMRVCRLAPAEVAARLEGRPAETRAGFGGMHGGIGERRGENSSEHRELAAVPALESGGGGGTRTLDLRLMRPSL